MSRELELPSSEWFASVRRRLRTWYGRHARKLPWRVSNDPYLVWVSEIMLQQTQVATVVPYFTRFVQAFPNVRQLAAANEDEVLRLWEGLGYYRRARQLHAAAKAIVAQHDGVFPADVRAAGRLAGIGRYTAGAILSIAYDLPEPILEANTIRLWSRLLAFEGDPRNTAGQQHLWRAASQILPRCGAGVINQALMELGSQVCTPSGPSCQNCPLSAQCSARTLGIVERVPLGARPKRYAELAETAVAVRRGPSVLIGRVPVGQRWSGLWDFVRFETPDATSALVGAQIAAQVAERTGVRVAIPWKVATLRHGVTRFRITLDCYVANATKGGKLSKSEWNWTWVPLENLDKYPLPVTGRKIAALVGRDHRRTPKSR